jgi:glycosyltransferase involved in cell wall biosynthesis
MTKRILILLKRWKGGVGAYVKNVSRELTNNGWEVKTISREDDLKINGLLESIITLRSLVKKEKFDIIYTQDWSLALPLLLPTPILQKKHFCCFHGQSTSFLSKSFQEYVGKTMGKNLIVVGDQLKKMFPYSNLIYEGVDTSLFKPLNKKRKGIGFANFKSEIYNFNIIQKACKELEEELIIAEGLNEKQMNEFYNKIEIFISLPPTYTGFGLVWLEAMAAGVPKVIGSNSGVGEKLPITKVKGFNPEDEKNYTNQEKVEFVKKAILESKRVNFKRLLLNNEFNWKKHAQKLNKIIL